jgi:hypothetical protein
MNPRNKESLMANIFPLAAPKRPNRSQIAGTFLGLVLLVLPGGCLARADAADLEREPIHYMKAPAHNAVSRLQERVDAGKTRLTYEAKFGYLRSLLKELNVPQSSQMLVFSKTSLQRRRIRARQPRALYFNDDAYVGFCQHGDLVEVAAADPQLSMVFYSLDQKEAAKPRFARRNDTCLICHGSSQNQGFPGLLVRSVYADAGGYPLLALGTHRIDHTSPLDQRWGGWYVTGTSGKQTHRGNLIVRDEHDVAKLDLAATTNVTDLGRRFKTSAYLTPHSDIVALMVLEHQAEMHNRITRANLQTRLALYEDAEINKALGKPSGQHSDSTVSRIKGAGDPLVEYLLLSEEARLTRKIQGTSDFAREFMRRGPHDPKGRSLRDLDLTRRLFKYPCSYLIYSETFDSLPGPVKDHVLRRLWDVLSGKDKSKAFAHLSAGDRRAILEILIATKRNLPAYWRTPSSASKP